MTPNQRTMIKSALEWNNRVPGRTLKIIFQNDYGWSGDEELFSMECSWRSVGRGGYHNLNTIVIFNIDDLHLLEE